MEQKKVIDIDKLYEFIDRCIEQSNECAEEASGNKRYASADLYDKRAKSLDVFKNLLEDADIYADEQPEPKWHYEDIDETNLTKYYGQEVEVWDDDINNRRIGILRGYVPTHESQIRTDLINGWYTWKHARVKVYEEG